MVVDEIGVVLWRTFVSTLFATLLWNHKNYRDTTAFRPVSNSYLLSLSLKDKQTKSKKKKKTTNKQTKLKHTMFFSDIVTYVEVYLGTNQFSGRGIPPFVDFVIFSGHYWGPADFTGSESFQ